MSARMSITNNEEIYKVGGIGNRDKYLNCPIVFPITMACLGATTFIVNVAFNAGSSKQG